MKLFLASEAKNSKSLKKLEEYIGGFKDKTIAYIPTAANGESGWESWKFGGSWEVIQTLGAKITLVQLENYQDRDPAEDIKKKDIVWFAGGSVGYLMYWIRRRQLEKKLKPILDAGTVFVGSSAGSMISGKDMSFAEWYVGEEEPGAGFIPGLGLVDFDFYPHYQEEHLSIIKEKYQGNKLYLVKDGEAIIVEDQKIEVFGEERIVRK